MLWGGTAFFSSLCSNSRDIAVLIKDYADISEAKFSSIIDGNLAKFEFMHTEEKYLMNLLYAPNEDKESRVFLESVFQDSDYDSFDHIIYAGDWNVSLNHKLDKTGYLHTNNNETHKHIKSRMITNELADVWRIRNDGVRAYTFDKKQTTNCTKARLDYFLTTQNTVRYVTDERIGRASTLSDHRPVYLTLTPSTIPTGRGFWRFDNRLLKDPDFIAGFNQEIKTVMKRYSSQLQNTENPKDEEFVQASWDISRTLLHDTSCLKLRNEVQSLQGPGKGLDSKAS